MRTLPKNWFLQGKFLIVWPLVWWDVPFFSRTPPTLWMSRFLPPHGFVGTLWKNLSHPPSFFVGSFQNGFLQVVCQGYSSIGWGRNKNGMYVPIHRQISDMTTAANFYKCLIYKRKVSCSFYNYYYCYYCIITVCNIYIPFVGQERVTNP